MGGPGRDEDYAELRVKARELGSLGTNRLGHLAQGIDRFLALSEQMASVRARLFWSRSNTLRIKLAAHDYAFENRTAEPDDRLLEPYVAPLLRDLVETINVFVLGDPLLMELDAARPGPQELKAAKEELEAFTPVLTAIVGNPNVATEAASEALQEQAGSVNAAGENLFERQAADFGRRSMRNFAGELLRRAYAPVRAALHLAKTEAGFALKGIREGAYRYAGAALAAAGVSDLMGATKIYSTFVVFVAHHAAALTAYIAKAFQNPTLIEIINWIVRFAA
jgi:hypothetical protein